MLTHLKNWDSTEKEVLEEAETAKRMRICGTEHNNLEDLFRWFCHTQANNIPVEGATVKKKTN